MLVLTPSSGLAGPSPPAPSSMAAHPTAPHRAPHVDFVTLGMFIIDDIYPPASSPNQAPQKDIIGGAGTYSAVGARLFSPAPALSKSVGWIVDAGPDFPADLRETIASWQTSVLMRPRDGLTTRGWNGYGANDHRAFRYLTDKKRLTADDLTPDLLASRSFHVICSPRRCVQMVERIVDRRRETPGQSGARPIVIWEPVPDLCTPDELENTITALRYADVISPNHEEVAALFSFKHPVTGIDKAAIEDHADRLVNHGIGPKHEGAVVVRASKEGCFVRSKSIARWLPAYHTEPSNVVDPTGGGNGFLGGLAVGLVRTGFDVVEAARWGSVAASYCIEQVGVPTLQGYGGVTEDDETWNGEGVMRRLDVYRKRAS